MGSAELIKEILAVQAAWTSSDRYSYRLVRAYQAASDVIELSKNGKMVGIVPLSTHYKTGAKPRNSNVFDPHNIRDPAEVLSDLRPAVRKNVEGKRRNIPSIFPDAR